MKGKMVLVGAFTLSLFAVSAHPAVPPLMNYQGKLTGSLGAPVPDGNYTIWFRIYTDSLGGDVLWVEEQPVDVSGGLFNVLLGSIVPIPDTIFTGLTRWLGIQVSPDPELTPRKPIVSMAYTFRSFRADTAEYALKAPRDDDWEVDTSGFYVYRIQGCVGIGTVIPESKLEVVGTAQMTGFKMPTGASEGYVLTSDGSGVGTWEAPGSADFADSARVAGESHLAHQAETSYWADSSGHALSSDSTTHSTWSDTADYALSSGNGSNWTLTDSVLYTNNYWGIARGSAGNVLYGDSVHTMVNLGVACTTGALGSNDYGCTVSGGHRNKAGNWGTVGRGKNNKVRGWAATVSGGSNNTVRTAYATIGGGEYNSVTPTDLESSCGTVAGGCYNTAHGWNATVGGGSNNTAGDWHATVGGGVDNNAFGSSSTVAGGSSNSAGPSAAVGGGGGNLATGGSVVGGGVGNTANCCWATVGGGENNTASGEYTSIGGGYENTASDTSATVSGGSNNDASGKYATVGGGRSDTATALYGGVFSGYSNMAGDESADTAAFVGGGSDNSATAKYATVSGGQGNTASDIYATVGGGHANNASQNFTTVAGGDWNTASMWGAAVGGGSSNEATNYYTTVGGGEDNAATEEYTTVGGGLSNHAQGYCATVAGGRADTVGGDYSFATGYGVVIDAAADYTFGFGRDFTTSTPNAVIFHNSSDEIKVGIGLANPGNILTVKQGSSTDPIADFWGTYSSKRWKTNIQPISQAVEKVKKLRGVYFDWKENGEHDIGMIAEEVGEVIPEAVAYEENGKDAQSVDYSRLVALLVEVLKELEEKNETQQKEIETLKAEIDALRQEKVAEDRR